MADVELSEISIEISASSSKLVAEVARAKAELAKLLALGDKMSADDIRRVESLKKQVTAVEANTKRFRDYRSSIEETYKKLEGIQKLYNQRPSVQAMQKYFGIDYINTARRSAIEFGVTLDKIRSAQMKGANVKNLYAGLAGEVEKMRSAHDKLSDSLKKEYEAAIQAGRSNRVLENQYTASVAAISRMNKAVTQGEKQMLALDAAHRRSAQSVGGFTMKLRDAVHSVSDMSSGINGLTASLTSIGFAYMTSEITQTGIELQRMQATLQASASEGHGAAEQFDYLREVADRLGVSYEGLSRPFARLMIAGRESNKTFGEIKPIFEGLITASAALGLSVEDTRGVVKAFEQMMSKGKVQAEELRQQLGDRLPGAYAIFARAYFMHQGRINQFEQDRAKSIAEFESAMKQGLVRTEDIMDEVAQLLQSRFGAAAAMMSTRIVGEFNRARNAFTDFAGSMFDSGLEQGMINIAQAMQRMFRPPSGSSALTEILSRMFTLFERLTKVIRDNIDLFTRLGAVFIGLFASSLVIKGLSLMVELTNKWSLALTAVVAVLVYFTSTTDKASTAMSTMATGMSGVEDSTAKAVDEQHSLLNILQELNPFAIRSANAMEMMGSSVQQAADFAEGFHGKLLKVNDVVAALTTTLVTFMSVLAVQRLAAFASGLVKVFAGFKALETLGKAGMLLAFLRANWAVLAVAAVAGLIVFLTRLWDNYENGRLRINALREAMEEFGDKSESALDSINEKARDLAGSKSFDELHNKLNSINMDMAEIAQRSNELSFDAWSKLSNETRDGVVAYAQKNNITNTSRAIVQMNKEIEARRNMFGGVAQQDYMPGFNYRELDQAAQVLSSLVGVLDQQDEANQRVKTSADDATTSIMGMEAANRALLGSAASMSEFARKFDTYSKAYEQVQSGQLSQANDTIKAYERQNDILEERNRIMDDPANSSLNNEQALAQATLFVDRQSAVNEALKNFNHHSTAAEKSYEGLAGVIRSMNDQLTETSVKSEDYASKIADEEEKIGRIRRGTSLYRQAILQLTEAKELLSRVRQKEAQDIAKEISQITSVARKHEDYYRILMSSGKDAADSYQAAQDAAEKYASTVDRLVKMGASKEQAEAAANIERQGDAYDRMGGKIATTYKTAAEKMEEVYKNSMQSIQGAFSDFFENIFSGGVDSFADLASAIKSIFIKLAAQIASLLVFQPVLGSFVNTISPTLASSLGVGGSSAGTGSSGGATDMLGMGRSVLGNFGGGGVTSAINGFGAKIGFGNLYTPGAGWSSGFTSASLSSVLGAGAMGGMGGGIISSLMGGNSTVGSVGGAVLSSVGMAVGGPVGAIVGSIAGGLLGGLFGGKKPTNAAAFGSVNIDAGTSSYSHMNKGNSAENMSQVQTAFDAVLQFSQSFNKLGVGTIKGSITGIDIGVRDAGKAYVNGEMVTAAAGQFGQLAINALKKLLSQTDIQNQDVKKVVANSTNYTDLNALLTDVLFGKNFRDTLLALRGGYGVENQYSAQAKTQVEELNQQLSDFISNTDRLGLGLAEAKDAVKTYVDSLVAGADLQPTLTQVEQTVIALKATWEAMTPVLETAGYTAAQAAQLIQQGLSNNMARLAAQYNQSVNDQIMQINDPTGYQLMLLDREFESIRREAVAVGADMVKIEELYGLKRQEILTSANESTIAAMRRAADNLRKWLDGQLLGDSSLSPYQKLMEAQSQFNTTLNSARGGNTDALDEITNKADAVLELARNFYASSVDFTLIEQSIRSQIENLGRTLNLPGFADGTNYAPGGMAIVGESGPEIVNLPRGSSVKSTSSLSTMIASSNDVMVNQVKYLRQELKQANADNARLMETQTSVMVALRNDLAKVVSGSNIKGKRE